MAALSGAGLAMGDAGASEAIPPTTAPRAVATTAWTRSSMVWTYPAEAVAAGWFGSVVEDRVAPRIGDVVATMTGPVAVVDSRRHRPELIALLGLHGSLTVDEVAIPWLTLDPLARTVGLPGRIPLPTFDWTSRAVELNTPTLILHGTRDDSAPIRLSQGLRDAHPDLVELETFDAGHTLCWNTDPDRWHETVTTWLNARVPR